MGPYTPHESFQLENHKNHKNQQTIENQKGKKQSKITKDKTIFFMKSFQKGPKPHKAGGHRFERVP